MRNLLKLAVLAGGVYAALVQGVGAETLKLLSSWPQNDVPSYSQAENFKKIVEEETDFDIAISSTEVVPALEQLQPVQAGVFDLLYTHGAYHAGSKGLALALDAIDPDPEKRRASGVFKMLDDYYQQNLNLKILAMTALSADGYHCYFRQAVTPDGDWSGLKMRGISSFHGVITIMGATPVSLPVGETYSALEKGVVDGSCMPAAGMLALKHYEVAKFRGMPTYGTAATFVSMNLDKWNSLSDSQKSALEKASLRVEMESIPLGRSIVAKEHEELDKLGVSVVTLGDANVKKIGDSWRDYQWMLADKCCGADAAKLRELSRAAGLTN